jgi:hypothetical protein
MPPGTLQTLTFGYRTNWSLNSVVMRSNLRSLTFGFGFCRSLRSVRKR